MTLSIRLYGIKLRGSLHYFIMFSKTCDTSKDKSITLIMLRELYICMMHHKTDRYITKSLNNQVTYWTCFSRCHHAIDLQNVKHWPGQTMSCSKRSPRYISWVLCSHQSTTAVNAGIWHTSGKVSSTLSGCIFSINELHIVCNMICLANAGSVRAPRRR